LAGAVFAAPAVAFGACALAGAVRFGGGAFAARALLATGLARTFAVTVLVCFACVFGVGFDDLTGGFADAPRLALARALEAGRRGTATCFGLAGFAFAGRAGGLAAFLADFGARADLAAVAVRNALAGLFAARALFDWAVGFMTLPACQAPGFPATPAFRRTDRARPAR
jgi:hypothetical protein